MNGAPLAGVTTLMRKTMVLEYSNGFKVLSGVHPMARIAMCD